MISLFCALLTAFSVGTALSSHPELEFNRVFCMCHFVHISLKADFLNASLLIFLLTKMCILLVLVLHFTILALRIFCVPFSLGSSVELRHALFAWILIHGTAYVCSAAPGRPSNTCVKKHSGFRQPRFHLTCCSAPHICTFCPQIGLFPMNQHVCQTLNTQLHYFI